MTISISLSLKWLVAFAIWLLLIWLFFAGIIWLLHGGI